MDINILLVDDDKVMVQRLEEGIDWKELGIAMVFTAPNIRQARRLLEEYPVDIMISDIEMPQGSGLELLSWVRERGIPVECLFLSSYAYFSYAQKALMLESREYILKPVSNRVLSEALKKLVDIVRERRKQEEGREEDAYYSIFWENVLSQKNFAQGMVEEAVSKGLYGREEPVCLALIKIFPSKDARKKKEGKLLHFIINNVTREFCGGGGGGLRAVVGISDYEWILAFSGKRKENWAGELCACLKKVLRLNVCMYIGQEGPFGRVNESREKLEEMEREAVPGEDGILFEADWGKKAPAGNALPWEAWENAMMDTDDLSGMGERILRAVTELWDKTQVTVPVFEQFRKELTQMVIHYLNQRNIRLTQIFDGEEYDEYYEGAVGTLTGMKAFVTWSFGRLSGSRGQDNRKEAVTDAIRRYIGEHLREDLSRKVLAQSVYLSEDYVSRIFMNATGMSIPVYVAGKRMEKAKDYLEHSDLSVSRIAMEVGYTNFSYFSKTFRDYTGSTPREYRNRVWGKEALGSDC